MCFYGFREAGCHEIGHYLLGWVVKRPHRANGGETSVCIPSVLYGLNHPKCTIWAFSHT